ncbi:rRNA-processing protein utp23 [Leucoagaricus sp. SymC.cos]|nr:rRNA-processing protein utp23 [Leucoagaricus sp. SymC.cos]
MRQKRTKAYRKLMHLYCQSFGFRQPYQVLVDAEICRTAISQKIDIVNQLGTVLQGEVKPMITQCCIHELYLQGKAQQPATDLAKSFERRKCNHKEAVPGDECLLSVVGDRNKHRYVIVTLSQLLRAQLRTVPATPIVHINRSVVVLEPPSDTTLQAKARAEEQVLHAMDLDKLHTSNSAPEPPPKKKRGPKGPNPLSVKRKADRAAPSSSGKAKDAVTKIGLKRKHEEGVEEQDDREPHAQKKKRKRKHTKSSHPIEQNTIIQNK